MTKAKRRSMKRPVAPALGRNFAIRPGAGAHKPSEQKRGPERLRREIEEQRDSG